MWDATRSAIFNSQISLLAEKNVLHLLKVRLLFQKHEQP
jgi:hypothetical protein